MLQRRVTGARERRPAPRTARRTPPVGVAAPSPQGAAGVLLRLQRTVGNRNVAKLIQRDGSKYAPGRLRDRWAKEKAAGDAKEPADADGGPSLLPAVEAVSKTITAIRSIAGTVQEITHDSTKTGTVALPPMVAGGKGGDYRPMYELEQIFLYMMAQEVCDKAFAIGKAHGVDFHDVGPDGRLRKAPDPAVAAGPAPSDDAVKALTVSLGALQDLANLALKAKVKAALETRIRADELPQGHFFWDADDNSGVRKMTEIDKIRGNLSGAWGMLAASVTIEHIPGGAVGGMPDDVRHFGLVPDHKPLYPSWVTGGAIDVTTHGDLDIEVTFTMQPHMHPPEGAYRIHSLWKWDESTTIMDCAITPAGVSFTMVADVKTSGEPDDGWF